MSRSREGSPSLAGWGGLVSKSEKPKKEKNKLQQIDIFGGTEELNIKRKKEVCPKKIYGSSAKHADPTTLKNARNHQMRFISYYRVWMARFECVGG